MQLELVHQQVQHVGGDKGGQVRAQVDVLDVQVQQGQQDGDGLLLEPRDGVVDGQLVVSDPKIHKIYSTYDMSVFEM